MRTSIAYFVTPHGFGHATRASAVMAAVHAQHPEWRFEVFTEVPRWVFDESVTGPFEYHSVCTDVGLAQASPMVEDLAGTVARLDALLPFRDGTVRQLAEEVRRSGCALVLCDIAPMGIAVARAAGVPSVLIEHFTWDWIYEPYLAAAPALQPHREYLRAVVAEADYVVQTEPVCNRRPAHLTTRPVSRTPRVAPAVVRADLGIPPGTKAVLLTMGGFDQVSYAFLDQLSARSDAYFVIPGATKGEIERREHVLLLPDHRSLFHPDLLNACDVVVGKLGYSTAMETYYAGLPFGYVSRVHLRESAVLGPYVRERMGGVEIAAGEFADGRWMGRLPELLARPRVAREGPNGALEVAAFVGSLLRRTCTAEAW
jgi:hypothetical protein